jgi:hypothetical protein
VPGGEAARRRVRGPGGLTATAPALSSSSTEKNLATRFGAEFRYR